MKKYFIVAIILISNWANAEDLTDENGRHVLVIKGGSYELNNASQDGRLFAASSDSVYGIEYEWHLWRGLSIGGEMFHYENSFTTTSTYEIKSTSFTFNAKYHFNHTGSFQPFIGVGGGFSYVDNYDELASTSYSTNYFGLAYQAMAGFTYRFKHIGIYAEYKTLNSRPNQHFLFINLDHIDISGKGALLGVTVSF